MTTEEIIEKFILKHGHRYLYDRVVYECYKGKVWIGCKVHGYFEQSVSNHLHGYGCAKCKIDYLASLRKLTTEAFIKRAIVVHGNVFDYSKVNYVSSYEPVIIICDSHGEFLQTPNSHLSGNGCRQCKYERLGDFLRLSDKEIIDRSNKVHLNRFSYLKIGYKTMAEKITVTCPDHGDFLISPINHLAGSGCPSCRSSKGEGIIETILRKHNIQFVREYILPDQTVRFRYDFYLPELNIVIEFHGIQHFEYIPFFHNNNIEEFRQQVKIDRLKKDLVISLGMGFLEFDYMQLKHLSTEDFEVLVSERILKACAER